jgi:lysophospholipase L1-like esterase
MSLRKLIPRLLASLGLLLASMIAAELLLWASGRLADPQEFQFRHVTRAFADDSRGRYRVDPLRFFTTAPDHRHGEHHLGRDATGRWPFRGRPGEPLPPDVLRVAVIGDSCVYGASLDAADMLGTAIQRGLAERGLTPDRVAVLSLGVPGYSTVQIDLLLREVLDTLSPQAVVLYPAAWNDQAPALVRPDAELLAALREPGPLDWLRQNTRLVAAALHLLERRPFQEILDGWRAGAPPLGYRVPEAQVEANVAGMLERCREAGAETVVIAPAHPPETIAEHPRTRRDAAAVARATRRGGRLLIDAHSIFVASGLEAGELFVDYVHPSPVGSRLVAEAVVDALAPGLQSRLSDRPPATGSLAIVDISPTSAPVLGDVPLRVTLAGWGADEALPEIVVGGSPLIGLHAIGDGMVEGRLMPNAAGRHELIAQTSRGCVWRPQAVELVDPTIRLEPGSPATVLVTSRPGDRVQLYVARARSPTAVWSIRGAFRLAADARPLPEVVVADEHGLARLSTRHLPVGEVLVQALVTPTGEPPEGSMASRWTAVTELGGDG